MEILSKKCVNRSQHLSDCRHGNHLLSCWIPPLVDRGMGGSLMKWVGSEGVAVDTLFVYLWHPLVLYIPTLWTVLTTHFMTSRSLRIMKSSFPPLPLVRAAETKTSKTKWATLKVSADTLSWRQILMVASRRKQTVLITSPRQKLNHCVNILISLVTHEGKHWEETDFIFKWRPSQS